MGHSALNKVLVLAFVLALVLQSGKRVANTSWEIGISLAHILCCIFKVSTNHKTSATEREKKSTALEWNLFFKSSWTNFKIWLNIFLWPRGRLLLYYTILQNNILSDTWSSSLPEVLFLTPNVRILLSDCLQWAVGTGDANLGHCPVRPWAPPATSPTWGHTKDLHPPWLHPAAWVPLQIPLWLYPAFI